MPATYRYVLSIQLVVQRVLRISQIKHNNRVRLGTTTVRKLAAEVDAAVKAEAAVIVNVDVQGVEVGRGVDEADLAGLHEVVGDSDVLLVGGYLDVVRADGGLVLVRVVEALDVVEVADVQGGDVVGGC